MFCATARTVRAGLPWLAVVAISLSVAYGMNMVVASGVAATTRADSSTPIVNARPVGSDVGSSWVVHAGPNCWLPDPSGLQSCTRPATGADR